LNKTLSTNPLKKALSTNPLKKTLSTNSLNKTLSTNLWTRHMCQYFYFRGTKWFVFGFFDYEFKDKKAINI
jgi:hypothetical protein